MSGVQSVDSTQTSPDSSRSGPSQAAEEPAQIRWEGYKKWIGAPHATEPKSGKITVYTDGSAFVNDESNRATRYPSQPGVDIVSDKRRMAEWRLAQGLVGSRMYQDSDRAIDDKMSGRPLSQFATFCGAHRS